MSRETKETNDYRVRMEGRLTCVETKLGEIISNHLPHLKEDMNCIKKRLEDEMAELRITIEKLDSRIWWILGSVILGIIIQFYFNLK